MDVYKAELVKWGAEPNKDLIKKATTAINDAQCTSLESQLCRSLKKSTQKDRKAGVNKYLQLYATVPPSNVQPVLWEAAQALVGKK